MGNSNSHPNHPHDPAHGPNSAQLQPSTHTPSTTTLVSSVGSSGRPNSQLSSAARRASSRDRPPSSTTLPHQQSRTSKGKKKPLELPDLKVQSLTPHRTPSNVPSAPIPIPNAGRAPREPPPRPLNDSDADLAAGPSSMVVPPPLVQGPPSPTNGQPQQQPPPPPPPSAGGTSSRSGSNASFTRRRGDRPPKKKAYKQYVVKSNLPSGVPTTHDGIINVNVDLEEQGDRVPILVTWRQGGNKVLITGTYEANPWENKTEMDYEVDSKCFKSLIHVSPAAYHLKFIVDDVWRCSDDLPTATDGAGNLVNYIDVRRRGLEVKEWGRDWWGVGTEDEEDEEQGAWSTQIPPFLTSAVEQEEIDEAVRRGVRGHNQRIVQFPLPRPPVLPRHLDKVILNQRVVAATTTPATGSSSRGRAAQGWVSPLTSAAAAAPMASGLGGIGNGGMLDLDSLSDRRRRERQKRVDGVSPIGDDNSVLPMPSHSVVNHLATSAIRNGVLAVGTTTRYKAKYISTICYGPTRPNPPIEEALAEDELAPVGDGGEVNGTLSQQVDPEQGHEIYHDEQVHPVEEVPPAVDGTGS